MLSNDRKFRSPSFRFDASALSGFITEPFEKNIPTLVPSALPQAGGFATARTGAFNLDELVSVSSAYTVVAARTERDGSLVALTTAVVEDLNILQVVTARRIVAQLMVTYSPPEEGKPDDTRRRRISLAGSRFEGLRIAGHDHTARLNAALQPVPASRSAPELPLEWDSLLKAGQVQAQSLLGGGAKREGEDAGQWPTDRHIVEIPGYGRIILGELNVTRESVQLVSIRAELGCLVAGVVNGPQPNAGGGGTVGGDK